jgi:hypothetical protein
MNALRKILPWILRLSGVTLVLIGIVLWTGHGANLVQLHMGLGLLFTATYLGIVALASRDGLALGPSLLAMGWGFVIPAFGMIQTRLLVGPQHWIIRVAHLLIAIVAMRIADGLAKGNPARAAEGMPDGLKA